MIGTLRGARWHRRGDRERAGAIHATLTIDAHTLELGASIPGVDQAWIVVDGAALLVDGWLVRALDPDPLALRVRTPLADAAGRSDPDPSRAASTSITLEGEHAADRAIGARRSTTRARARGRTSPQLAIVALPDGPRSHRRPRPRPRSAPARTTATIGGPCPGAPALLAMRIEGGDLGCVEPAALAAAVLAAAAALDGPEQASIADPRPLRAAADHDRLADGTLDLAKRPQIAIGTETHDADPDRVAELVAALAEPAELAAPSTAQILTHLRIAAKRDEPFELELHRGGVLHRSGETTWLRPTAAAWAALTRPIRTYVEPTRWIEDPSTVSAIAIDDVTYTRGAVLGEWSPATTDPKLVEALAIAVARVRAPAHAVPASFTPLHRVTVTLTPPIGAPVHHALELGALGPDGCLARVDRVPVLAPLSLCAAAFAAAKH